MIELQSPIGLIAGNGQFPREFLLAAKNKQLEVVVVGHINESDPQLSELCTRMEWVRVGQLSKIIKVFKKNKVKQVALLGGIKRARLFRDAWPDFRTLKVLSRLASKRDDGILRALAQELESEGMQVFSATELLSESVARCGVLTNRDLTPAEKDSAKLAWQAAHCIGTLDIGQAAVAYQGLVVALEAIEGTDEMLKRAGSLIAGRISKKMSLAKNENGAVLVKLSKPGQDLRLDLPSVGKETITNMQANSISALVLEANKSIILCPAEVINAANKAGIAIAVWNSEDLNFL